MSRSNKSTRSIQIIHSSFWLYLIFKFNFVLVVAFLLVARPVRLQSNGAKTSTLSYIWSIRYVALMTQTFILKLLSGLIVKYVAHDITHDSNYYRSICKSQQNITKTKNLLFTARWLKPCCLIKYQNNKFINTEILN